MRSVGLGEVAKRISSQGATASQASDMMRASDGIVLREYFRAYQGEYVAYIDLSSRLDSICAKLATARDLGLQAAPSVDSRHRLADGDEILVLRYPTQRGERLLRAADVPIDFSDVGVQRLLHDARVLAEHSLYHRYARGDYHWLVGAESGAPFWDDWQALDKGTPADIEEFLENMQRTVTQRSAKVQASLNARGKARLVDAFGASKVLLPVIHPVSATAARENARLAHQVGCRGIFLINQGTDEAGVFSLVLEIRREFPSLWVGVNILGEAPADVLTRGLAACEGRLDGIWTDNAGVTSAPKAPLAAAFWSARVAARWHGLYFGGTAFKYQPDVAAADLPAVARRAGGYMDAVCTSGPGTGLAASIDKVERMREGLDDTKALALASGVTPDNVTTYLPYVDAFLVGTGIEREFGVFDQDRLEAVQRAISSWSPASP